MEQTNSNNNYVEIGINLAAHNFRQSIINLINQSNLPAVVVQLELESIKSNIDRQMMTVIADETKQYKEKTDARKK